jgi:hypothetical protein
VTRKSFKAPYTAKIDTDLLHALKHVKAATGVNESEQIRRGLRMWFASQGVDVARAAAAQRERGRRGK